jgi:hypothetical protein
MNQAAAHREFKREWPEVSGPDGLPSAVDLTQFGLSVRGHLRETNDDSTAAEMWKRIDDPSSQIVEGYDHAGQKDARFARILQGAGKEGMPPGIARVMTVHLEREQGMRAWQALCARVFVRTEVSTAQLKRNVRNPRPELDSRKVAARLGQQDSDLAELIARGYGPAVDDADRRHALYTIVSKLDAFKATVEALKQSVPGGFPSVAVVRQRLGEEAADLARGDGGSNPKAKAKAAKKKKARAKKAATKATEAKEATYSKEEVKAMMAAMVADVKRRAPRPPKASNNTATEEKQLCRDWKRGKCTFGDRCNYEHGLRFASENAFQLLSVEGPGGSRSKFMALMAEVYDGSTPKTFAGELRASLQTYLGTRRTRPAMGAKAPTSESGAPGRRRALAEAVAQGVRALVVKCKARKARKVKRRRRRGPVADTGADEHFVGAVDLGLATDVRGAAPVVVSTAHGDTVAKARAGLPVAMGLMPDGLILPSCDESLCSVGKVCEDFDLGYTVDPGNGSARFFDKEGATVLELVKDGRRFRVPFDDGIGCQVFAYAAAVPSWYLEHAKRGHMPHRADCEHCVRGRFRERRSERKPPVLVGDRAATGYTMSADFTGKEVPDIDGHTVALIACVHGFGNDIMDPEEEEAAFGFVALLEKRTAAATAKALDEFDKELQLLGLDKGRCIVRFHTDVDRSFLAEVEALAIRKGWRQTDTGGYKSAANGKAERRIGLLKQTSRTVVLAAGGATGDYYVPLWGHALIYSNKAVNVNDWRSRRSPHEQLTGRKYEYTKRDHAFGTYCTWGVPKENRGSSFQQSGEQGLWMRQDPVSTHCDVVVPIEWDATAERWILKPTIVATRVKVYDGVMPLRMKPAPGSDPRRFKEFMDRVCDPYHEAQALKEVESTTPDSKTPSSSRQKRTLVDEAPKEELSPAVAVDSDYTSGTSDEDTEEWEVERILNRKVSSADGKILYLLKWKGYSRKHNTWEPEAALEGCPKLLKQFEKERRAAKRTRVRGASELRKLELRGLEAVLRADKAVIEAYASVASPGDTAQVEHDDDLMAVAELMSKQGLIGDPNEWVPGYRKELDNVTNRRLTALPKAEQLEAWRKKLVVKLRMILEEKRDGRKKGRLVLQGFREPWAWEQGVSPDSPVAYMVTIRMLVFMAGLSRHMPDGKRQHLSSRDISVAFLQSTEYAEGEQARYVSYKAWKSAPENVYRLRGPLYGQRSAGRRWYETIAGWLTDPVNGLGLIQSDNEPCLFVGREGFCLALYVDDLLVRGTWAQSEDFHSRLGERFECRDAPSYLTSESPLEFLGFRLTLEEQVDDTHVYMDQSDALGVFLAEFDLEAIRSQDCPMPSLAKLYSDPEPLTEAGSSLYRHAVGFLNFLSKTTRYDVAHPTSMMSMVMKAPTKGALRALKHVLGYLKQSVQFRIGGKCTSIDTFDFHADSDHASTKPHSTRSQTGAMLMLNGIPVGWLSKRQPITAVSPAEAEVHALRDAIIAARLIQWVAEDMCLDVKWPLVMCTDSTQAHSFQHNTCPKSRMRGCFDLREKSIKEMRDKGVVTAKYVPRHLNMADLLTHCLSRCKFREQLQRAQNFQRYNCKGACVFIPIFSIQLSQQ